MASDEKTKPTKVRKAIAPNAKTIEKYCLIPVDSLSLKKANMYNFNMIYFIKKTAVNPMPIKESICHGFGIYSVSPLVSTKNNKPPYPITAMMPKKMTRICSFAVILIDTELFFELKTFPTYLILDLLSKNKIMHKARKITINELITISL